MSTVQDRSTSDPAASLRAAMVDHLREVGAIKSDLVAAVVAKVPRELFALGEPLEAAYDPDKPLTIKSDQTGAALSSLSAAHLQAVMLEQAEIEPGMRVLEIGTAGYNAALLWEIVGKRGNVISVDIDPEIVHRSRSCLAAAGYNDVQVVLADADNGVPEGAPYDRIIVTAGAWDIPPAWIDQLAPGGRIVVPLRIKGLTRSIAFERDGGELVSRSYGLCSFVPMQGSGSHMERLVPIDDGVMLQVDGKLPQVDPEALRNALQSSPIERWSGAAYDLPDELQFFLVTSGPQVALLRASQDVIEQGRIAPSAALGVPALISGGSLAYRIRRENELTGGFESGVIAYGPEAETVAAQYVHLLYQWARHHRRRGAARIRYVPGNASAFEPSQEFVAKRHGAVAVSWS